MYNIQLYYIILYILNDKERLYRLLSCYQKSESEREMVKQAHKMKPEIIA